MYNVEAFCEMFFALEDDTFFIVCVNTETVHVF